MRWPLIAWPLMAWLCAGCAGPVVAEVTVKPPEPVPAPVERDGEAPAKASEDADGDGVAGAADGCPEGAESVNQHQDDDGCPDEAPPFFLAGYEIRYRGTIEFLVGGRLAEASEPVLDGIAKVLRDHPEVELLEVGVHLLGRGAHNAEPLTRSRASTLVDALTERGVSRERLRPAGYGTRCGGEGEGVRVDLAVVRLDGEPTGAKLGCSS